MSGSITGHVHVGIVHVSHEKQMTYTSELDV